MRSSNTSLSRLLLVGLIGTLTVNVALALDPNRRLSQYIHDRWGAEKGLPGGRVHSISQTGDGYLWIGTETGLSRFDGITFDTVPLPAGRNSPSTTTAAGQVLGLTADEQGGLWIRMVGLKLSHYLDGNFRDIPSALQPQDDGVTVIARAGAAAGGQLLFGTAWHGVKALRAGKLETIAPPEYLPRSPAISLARLPNGEVWVGTREEGLVRVTGGHATAVTAGLPGLKVNCLLPAGGDQLLIGTDNGIVRWNGIKIVPERAMAPLGQLAVLTMIMDRDENTWIGTSTKGLLRLNRHGLSTAGASGSEAITALFEDREGNLWIGSRNGIERLRDSVFATYSTVEGAAADSYGPVYTDSQNQTWFAGTGGGLYALREGRATRVAVPGLGNDIVYSIDGNSSLDRGGELWLGRQLGGLTHLVSNNGRLVARTYTKADGLAQDSVFAVALSRDGAVWAGTLNGGVSRLYNGHFSTYTVADGLASNTVSSILESVDGTMWFATPKGLSMLSHSTWRTFEAVDGLPSDNVNSIFQDSTGAIWAGTLEGIAVLQSSRFHVPETPASLHQQILGIAEDKSGFLWITTSNHVLRVNRDRLYRTSASDPLRNSDIREYQLADGLASLSGIRRHRSVVADSHGTIWLSMARGLSAVDPARLSAHSVPAMVHIAAMSADGNAVSLQGPVRIPAGSQRITLGYAGLNLSIPERTRFRYTLDGVDHGWSEPATAREVIYSNLGPGSYRFRVIASNRDEIFNSAEASLVFEVEPLFWQRWSFRAALALALGFAIMAFVRLRVRRFTEQMNVRFEERLAERTRLAGELHDTILQTVQATKMIADNVRDNPAADPIRLREAIVSISDWLAQATTEGRAALNALRTSTTQKNNLAEAFQRAAKSTGINSSMRFVLSIEGTVKELHPIVRDEVYRIGCEAIRNAQRHSNATELRLTLSYAGNLTMLVHDNGAGIDPDLVARGRPGHFGLRGMTERSERIHAKLRIFSRPNAGTEIELVVPGNIVYRDASAARRPWLDNLLHKLPGYKRNVDKNQEDK